MEPMKWSVIEGRERKTARLGAAIERAGWAEWKQKKIEEFLLIEWSEWRSKLKEMEVMKELEWISICGAAMGRRPGCFSSFRRNERGLSLSSSINHQSKKLDCWVELNWKRMADIITVIKGIKRAKAMKLNFWFLGIGELIALGRLIQFLFFSHSAL